MNPKSLTDHMERIGAWEYIGFYLSDDIWHYEVGRLNETESAAMLDDSMCIGGPIDITEMEMIVKYNIFDECVFCALVNVGIDALSSLMASLS